MLSIMNEIDSCLLLPLCVLYRYKTRFSNILSLKICFVSVCFRWVNRECNVAAHAAAKHSMASKMSLCCNKDNLPRVVYSACMDDCLHIPLY